MARALLNTPEFFGSQASYTGGAPGGFVAITGGTCARQMLGGRTTGDRGFHGRINSTSFVSDALTGNVANGYIWGYIRFKSFDNGAQANAVNHIVAAAKTAGYAGTDCVSFRIQGNGTATSFGSTNSNGSTTLSLNTWYEFSFTWAQHGGGSVCIGFLSIGTPGAVACVSSGASLSAVPTAHAGFCNRNAGGGGTGSDYNISAMHVYSHTNPASGNQSTGTTNFGSQFITGVTGIGFVQVGHYIVMPGFPIGTTVESVGQAESGGANTFKVSAACTRAGTNTTKEFNTYASTDYPAKPAGVTAPPTGYFNFYMRNDAVGGGDGSANNAANALRWSEATVYSGVSIGITETWYYFGAPMDPTGFTATAIHNDIANVIWMGDTITLGTDFNPTSPDMLSGHLKITSVDTAAPFTISGLQSLTGPFVEHSTAGIWTVTLSAYTGMYEDGKPMAKVLASALGAAATVYTEVGSDAYADVETALLALKAAGIAAFYNDDAGNGYFVSSSSEPNDNGSSYGCSINLGANSLISGDYIHGVYIDAYTSVSTKLGAMPGAQNGYAWTLGGVLGIARETRARFGSKHSAGCLGGVSDSKRVLVGNNVIDQCTPTEWLANANGATTAYVSFNDGVGGISDIMHYLSYTCRAASQKIGSLQGRKIGVAFYEHTTLGNLPYSHITLGNCDLSGGSIEANGGVINFQILNPMASGDKVAKLSKRRSRVLYL
jgi:hypothetical protein